MMLSTLANVTTWQSDLERDGYAILPEFADPRMTAKLLQAIAGINDTLGMRRRGSTYGIRNLLDVVPEVRRFAESSRSVPW